MAPAKYTLGEDAIIRVAPVAAVGGAKPAAAAFKELCLVAEVTLGLEKGSITFANFCTKGQEVEISTGAKGILSFGEAQWVEGDEALEIMEDAAFGNGGSGEVYYEVMPTGAGAGKAMFEGRFTVKKWEMKVAAAGLITVSHDVLPTGVPEKSAQA